MDHMTIADCGSLYHSIHGPVWGVADNCVIDASGLPARADMIDSMGDYGDTWNNFTFNFGTADNFYWEDCTLFMSVNGDVWDAGAGNRYAVRYCTIHHVEEVGGYGMFPPVPDSRELGSHGL